MNKTRSILAAGLLAGIICSRAAAGEPSGEKAPETKISKPAGLPATGEPAGLRRLPPPPDLRTLQKNAGGAPAGLGQHAAEATSRQLAPVRTMPSMSPLRIPARTSTLGGRGAGAATLVELSGAAHGRPQGTTSLGGVSSVAVKNSSAGIGGGAGKIKP